MFCGDIMLGSDLGRGTYGTSDGVILIIGDIYFDRCVRNYYIRKYLPDVS